MLIFISLRLWKKIEANPAYITPTPPAWRLVAGGGWTNLLNGKCYVGSGANLSIRLSHYFSNQHLETQLKSRKSAIYSAILGYGLSNFSLEILEYCSPSDAVLREQYYIDLLKPEYNLLKTAGSWLGNKHSEESKAKLSENRKGTYLGEYNPFYGKNHTEESKKKNE